MSSSSFLSHSNCGPTSHASLLLLSFYLCLYFHLSLSLSLYSICLSMHLSCFASRCTVGEQAFAGCFVFYEWDVLFTLFDRAISVSADDEHIQCDHQLLPLLPCFLSLAKALLSMAKAACACMCVFVCQSFEGSQRG